jgi:hypothetical protein
MYLTVLDCDLDCALDERCHHKQSQKRCSYAIHPFVKALFCHFRREHIQRCINKIFQLSKACQSSQY